MYKKKKIKNKIRLTKKTTPRKSDEEIGVLINQIGFLSAVNIELIDELKELPFFRHELAMTGNAFVKELEKITSMHFNFYETDAKMITTEGIDARDYYANTGKYLSRMAKLFRERKPSEICSMLELIEKSEREGLNLGEVLLTYTPILK